MICNFSDSVINNTLNSNEVVFIVDEEVKTDINGWQQFGGTSAGNYEIRTGDAATKTYLQASLPLQSLGTYGSGCVGFARGEICMEGTNQANTTNFETRLNVLNEVVVYSGSTLIDVSNTISCDYVCKINPSKLAVDAYISVEQSNQAADKVAGDTDWNPIVPTGLNNAHLLKGDGGATPGLLPDISSEDNLMITGVITNYQCIKFYISHDTAGNMEFINLREVANTQRKTPIPPPRSQDIDMKFGETSYPIMPFVGTCGYYCADANNVLIQGNFSNLDATTQNLATLYNTINTNWSLDKVPPATAYTIPPRMTELEITDICFNKDLQDRNEGISPDGFSGITAAQTITFPLSQQKPIGFEGYVKAVVRLGDFSERSNDGKRLIQGGLFNYEPSRLTQLNRQMGFNRLLLSVDSDPTPNPYSEALWVGSNTPEPNLTPNYIVNIANMGRVQGNNSATGSISQMIGVIPNAELYTTGTNEDRHYVSPYALPIKLNATTKENINNFTIYITRDNGRPAENLLHPSNFLLRIT